LSLAELITKTFRPMPDSDKATVERYIERAMEELSTAYEELRSSEQLRAVMDAVQRFRKVVAEFQEAISKVQPYATTDTEAAKLAVKLGMIAYAIQLVQQRLAEIQAAINGAMQSVPAPTPVTPVMGGMGAS
jgi:methionyl-tRNA synthetase